MLMNIGDEMVEVGEGRMVFFQYVLDVMNDFIFFFVDGEYFVEVGCWWFEDYIVVIEEYWIFLFEFGELWLELVDFYGVVQFEGDEVSCFLVGEFCFEVDFVIGGFFGFDGERQEVMWGFLFMLE